MNIRAVFLFCSFLSIYWVSYEIFLDNRKWNFNSRSILQHFCEAASANATAVAVASVFRSNSPARRPNNIILRRVSNVDSRTTPLKTIGVTRLRPARVVKRRLGRRKQGRRRISNRRRNRRRNRRTRNQRRRNRPANLNRNQLNRWRLRPNRRPNRKRGNTAANQELAGNATTNQVWFAPD